MPRGGKRGGRRGRRRLQAAVAGLFTNAAVGATAAKIANTFTTGGGMRSGATPAPKQEKSKSGNRKRGNLRGSYLAVRRANSEGYIAPVSTIISGPNQELSFTERVQKIMNPPQTALYQSTAKYEAASGRQGVSSFTINNVYFADFFTFMPAGKSDNAAATSGIVDATANSNQVNHLYTSVMHTFMNSCNVTAELDIYIFEALQDIRDGDQPKTAAAAWAYAEAINGLSGVANDGQTQIGKKPTDTSCKSYMNRWWKMLGKTTVTMKAGESFKHYFRKHYNAPYERHMLMADAVGITKKHSVSFVYVVRGQVVGSSLNGDLSTADAQISCVRQTKLQYCYARSVRPRDFLLGSDLTQIAAANQIFMNTDTSTQITGNQEDA